MSGGINFDTTSLGGGGNYGGGYGYGYGGGFGCGIQPVIDISNIFGHRGHHDDHGFGKNCGCCAPATCEQVNDVDRDVLKSAFSTTEAVHDEGRTVDRDVLEAKFDLDREIILGDKCIQDKICESTHLLEKRIDCVDKDVLMGFCDTNRHIDKVETLLTAGFCKVENQIKETALCQENKELARKVEKLQDKINKKDTVSEILAALGVTPVIANSSTIAG